MSERVNCTAMRDLLHSLAWSSWSAYHSGVVIDILHEHFPELDASCELKKFREAILSPQGEGSPK